MCVVSRIPNYGRVVILGRNYTLKFFLSDLNIFSGVRFRPGDLGASASNVKPVFVHPLSSVQVLSVLISTLPLTCSVISRV